MHSDQSQILMFSANAQESWFIFYGSGLRALRSELKAQCSELSVPFSGPGVWVQVKCQIWGRGRG